MRPPCPRVAHKFSLMLRVVLLICWSSACVVDVKFPSATTRRPAFSVTASWSS